MPTTAEHPRIRPGVLEDRAYQTAIARAAVDHNTLVVLPTGLGKTAIALRVAAEQLLREPTRSILFLAPTRPLVVQHAREAERTLFAPSPLILTGSIAPDRRAALLRPPQVVVATPQVVANDLEGAGFPLETFSLIVFDEAHRAVGDYPYVVIGRTNRGGPRARVLAMTASPGGSLGRIREVWANLAIERFEYRTERSADVAPYLHGVGVETVEVPVPPEVRHLAILLRAAVARAALTLSRLGLLAEGEVNRRSVLAVGEQLHRRLAVERAGGGAATAGLWSAVTAQSVVMKGLHALDLIESQGVDALREFLARQSAPTGRRVTPAQRAFLGDPDVQEVRRRLAAMTLEHPKLAVAVTRVRQELVARPEARVIVFSQYRDTVDRLVAEFAALRDPAVRAARFVGQATHGSDPGLSQKAQVAILDRFRRGELNCLVATSVAEEGLDIPATDLVVFYEPIPDVIRTIQRRGRTGRARRPGAGAGRAGDPRRGTPPGGLCPRAADACDAGDGRTGGVRRRYGPGPSVAECPEASIGVPLAARAAEATVARSDRDDPSLAERRRAVLDEPHLCDPVADLDPVLPVEQIGERDPDLAGVVPVDRPGGVHHEHPARGEAAAGADLQERPGRAPDPQPGVHQLDLAPDEHRRDRRRQVEARRTFGRPHRQAGLGHLGDELHLDRPAPDRHGGPSPPAS